MSANIDSDFLKDQNTVTIFLKDGYKFWEANAEVIARRFADPNKRTVIAIVHPDSPAMKFVTEMDPGKDIVTQRSDCIEAVRIIQIIREVVLKNASVEEQKSFDDRVIFVGHNYVPTWNGVVGDDTAIINTYATGPAPRGPMPSMTIKGHAYDYAQQNCAAIVTAARAAGENLFDYAIPPEHADKRGERTTVMDADNLRVRLNAALHPV